MIGSAGDEKFVFRRLSALLQSGVSRILTGTLIGQGTLLAVSPLLTRLYDVSDFGALAAFTALATVAGGIVSLSWERAIVIPCAELSARALAILTLASTAVMSALLTVLMWFGGPWLDTLLQTAGIFSAYWWLLPLTTMAMGTYSALSSTLIRDAAYGRLAVRNGIQGTSQALSSVVLGLLAVGPLGLLSSILVGRVASSVGMAGSRGERREWPSPLRVRVVARRYRRFPLVVTWSRVLNILGLQLPPLIVIAMYGSIEAGLYALTIRVLATPIGMVVDAVSQYFEGTFATRRRERSGRLSTLLLRISTRLLAVAVVPAIVVAVFGPVLFGFVFGAEWAVAGQYAQITVLFYLAQFAVAPISRALLVLERQYLQLAWDVSRTVLICAAVLLPGLCGLGLAAALIVLTIVQVAMYAALFLLCLFASRRAEAEWA